MARRLPALLDIDELDELPAQVYLAAQSPLFGSRQPVLELRESKSGQIVLMAYSSLGTLHAACGSGQSWVRVPSRLIPPMRREVGFHVVALDMSLPPEMRHDPLGHDEPGELETIDVGPRTDGEIYVATRALRPDDQRVAVELHRAPNGERALLAYYSPESLRAACGPYQHWVSFPARELTRVAQEAGAETVLFNGLLAPDSRHTEL